MEVTLIRRLLVTFVVLLTIAAGCDEDLETVTGVDAAATPSITIIVVTPEG